VGPRLLIGSNQGRYLGGQRFQGGTPKVRSLGGEKPEREVWGGESRTLRSLEEQPSSRREFPEGSYRKGKIIACRSNYRLQEGLLPRVKKEVHLIGR